MLGLNESTIAVQRRVNSRGGVLTCAAYCLIILMAAGLLAFPGQGHCEPLPDRAALHQVSSFQTAPVTIDGAVLFHVRGVEALPAEERARRIAHLIEKTAQDHSVSPVAVTAVESEFSTDIVAGPRAIMLVLDADAQREGLKRQVLANVYVAKIRQAVEQYRKDRAPREIWLGILWSGVATIALLASLLLARLLFRRFKEEVIDARLADKIDSIRIQSFVIVNAQQIKALLKGILRTVRLATVLVLFYLYAHLVLGLFPWSRSLSVQLLDFLLGPLATMGRGFLRHAPNLIFLGVLLFVANYLFKLLRLFFDALESGTITFPGFYPEWAKPTFRIVGFLLIAFMAVVAFPYIPGSNSPAFKGISIFLGVIFSLGSSSVISNVLAGLTMTYRRAFRIGDRVMIGEYRGEVAEMRLLVTHLRTAKNEEIVVPNSVIINNNVINYSSLAKEKGLVLHTCVTVGYHTPWRQVYALLLQAASRTPGLLPDPPPFVRQTALDQFFVRYEINAYTDSARGMMRIYSALHENIQDAFNEYGVQIMTPRYACDPEPPAVVPREHWYEPPAQRPEAGAPQSGNSPQG